MGRWISSISIELMLDVRPVSSQSYLIELVSVLNLVVVRSLFFLVTVKDLWLNLTGSRRQDA